MGAGGRARGAQDQVPALGWGARRRIHFVKGENLATLDDFPNGLLDRFENYLAIRGVEEEPARHRLDEEPRPGDRAGQVQVRAHEGCRQGQGKGQRVRHW